MANLRQIRKERGMSAQEIAEKLGITRQAVFSWERGTSKPTLTNALKLAAMLDCTVSDLVDTE